MPDRDTGNSPLTEQRWLRLLNRFRWCKERSPEGYPCIYRRGHDGLHVPHMGRGWAWGGKRV